jgi:hypothetical protein
MTVGGPLVIGGLRFLVGQTREFAYASRSPRF